MSPKPSPVPSTHPEPVGLTTLPVGAEARFHGTSLGRADLEILEALGLTGACRLRVCQAGDPWIVQVRATRIGIAEAVARAILVVPEAGVAEGAA
ncbi:MAG TPA: FeoA family protein [Thermoanaerobaculia bacterium]|nr:FeoA family protein [Thermoanaerobaculia bacterium]